MTRSRPATFRIGTAFGIPIEIHPSWGIAFVLAVVSLSVELKAGAGRGVIATALATALALFASIVAHELGHSVVALRCGIRVRRITLFVFGGIAQLGSEPRRPRDELLIAAAGPLVSAAIGLLALVVARSGVLPPPVGEPIAWLGRANFAIFIFNCLPGFPLDGGRMLRAVLWMRRGDPMQATVSAARVGRGMAYGLIAIGGLGAISGGITNGLWLAFLGWFLLQAADASALDAAMRGSAGDAVAVEAMSVDFPVSHPDRTVADYVEDVVLRTGHRAHLVVDAGRIVGVVTLERAISVAKSFWPELTIGQVAVPLEQMPSVTPKTPLLEALEVIGEAPLAVVRQGASVLGVLDRERLLAVIRAHMDVGPWARRTERAPCARTQVLHAPRIATAH